MEKCHWIAIAYALLEHKLGKTESGSMIGLVKKLAMVILKRIQYNRGSKGRNKS